MPASSPAFVYFPADAASSAPSGHREGLCRHRAR